MNLRERIIAFIGAHRSFPRGDFVPRDREPSCDISCIINYFDRFHLMENILSCLTEQTLPRDRFEVILVEDRGGSDEGRALAERFQTRLPIVNRPLPEHFGKMGFSRNYGLTHARGRYVLFLDDDTVILQPDFLATLIEEFERSQADMLIPRGSASFCLFPSRYAYHTPYYPTLRCTAYRREVLQELGGFVSSMTAQEDVDFTIRFLAAGKRYHRSTRLAYFHPHLIVDTPQKAKAVGISFARLRTRYPLPLWLLVIANGLRFLPLFLLPLREEWKMYARFSLGFLKGIVQQDKEVNYR